jgi:hypothetical protein
MASKAKATAITDHDEIRQWAEERDAKPACVRNTRDTEDVGILRLEFPGYSGEESLEAIEWDLWFEKFDEQGLALLHQETTANGQKSNFNKLISRETAANTERTRSSKPTLVAKSRSTTKTAARPKSKSTGSNVRRSAEVKPAQKRDTITNISRKQEGAKPSPHARPRRGRAA